METVKSSGAAGVAGRAEYTEHEDFRAVKTLCVIDLLL